MCNVKKAQKIIAVIFTLKFAWHLWGIAKIHNFSTQTSLVFQQAYFYIFK